MKSSIVKAMALAATAMGVVQAVPAFAQEAAEASGSDIIVTARRIDERLQDVPISITVFNPEQIAARNIVNSTDLATYTPSLAANSRFGTEKASFAIRSFTQDLNTAPTVGVYFADVVSPRLASNITSGNGAGVGAMFDLQNVQVLKGPQGTLFGRNTTGGAILLVPQRPTDDLQGYVEGTYGNHDARRAQAVINIPLADTFKIRAGVDRYVRDGYINNRSGIGPSKFNNVNYWSVRLSVLAELTPDLENYAIFTWSTTNTNGMLGHMVACNRGTVAGSSGATAPTRAQACAQLDRERAAGFGFYDAENDLANPFVRQSQWQVINSTTWKATDNLTVKNIASYAVSRESYSFNISGDNFSAPLTWVTATFPGPNLGQDKRANWTEELQLQGQNGNLTWQVGGYIERSQPQGGQFGSQQQYTAVYAACTDLYAFKCVTSSPVGSISIANNVYTYRTEGIYAQATFKLTNQFSVTAGIRNTWEYAHVDANNVRIVPTATGVPAAVTCSRATPFPLIGLGLVNNPVCTRSFTAASNKPTWLIDVDYKPTDDILIYAKWARGYRGGGVNEANFGIEAWNPERLDTYEAGLKASFRGSVSGNINIAGFWNEFKDQQTSVFIPSCITGQPGCTNPAPTGINGIQNVSSSRIKGVEVDGSLILFEDLRIDFGYAYLDAKVTGGAVPFCDNSRFNCGLAGFLTTGTTLLFAPKNRFTVTGTYTLPLPESVGAISFGATFVHTDKQFQSHTNDLPAAQGAIPESYGLLPKTDLLNLNLNWKNVAGSTFDIALFCTNVTNEKYRVATAGGLPSTGGEFILVGEPRMFGARLKYRFGM